jgi:predicted RNA-binding Zn-ribbon protein involved in translation (DUF1610 family)
MKCPKCGKEIDSLKCVRTGITYEYYFYINEDGEGDYEWEDDLSEDDVREFYCPECYELLFEDEEGAKRFLKGEVE